MKKFIMFIVFVLLTVVVAAGSGPWPQSEVALTGTATNPTISHYFHLGYDAFILGGTTVDTNYYTVTWPADPSGNYGFTISNAGLLSYTIGSNNAAATALTITDTYQPASGQIGSTAEIAAYFQQTSDSGGSFQTEEAGRMYWYKVNDHWNASGQADNDTGFKFDINVDGTLTNVLTIASTKVAAAAFSATTYYDSNTIPWYSAGAYVAYGAVSASAYANRTYIGYNGFSFGGETSSDGKNLKMVWPTYSDVTDGNITTAFVVKRSVPVTVADTGADADPATATLTPRPTANLYLYTVNDDDGCTCTVSETGSEAGQTVIVQNTTAYALNLANQAGILNLNAACALVSNQTITLAYDGSQWNELSRSSSVITMAQTFSYDGIQYARTGALRWMPPANCTIVSCTASLNTAPTGANFVVDVNKNGTTIYTTQGNRPTITATEFVSLAKVPDVTALTISDYLQCDVDVIGSTIPGSDLTVRVIYTIP